ncbi:MAG: holo-ACP synthase [Alcanivorax sp.]|jgi:holo-[acyl-carrier protein] synthase|nr:MAG: holo-ACP synthase [Oceanobacter sp.]|tara:strand:- start:1950 stop:2345 length:396 start_codon:yes stop_codon:yes gene_type:complete
MFNSAAILGVGTDLISQDRIGAVIQRHGERFPQRILASDELAIYQTHSSPINYLTKAFAAKEALAKALGTGIALGVTFHDFSILRNANGAPEVVVRGRAKGLMDERSAHAKLLISLSDEGDWVQAFAVLSS